jgi:hypothetical protein
MRAARGTTIEVLADDMLTDLERIEPLILPGLLLKRAPTFPPRALRSSIMGNVDESQSKSRARL